MASIGLKRLLSLITTGFAVLLSVPFAFAQETVTYNMGWLAQGSQIGVIVAEERGWFRDLGLNVRIMRGYGGPRTVQELDQGQYEFGYVDPISLALNRANGGKTKVVGAINTRWPAAICWVVGRVQGETIDGLRSKVMGGGTYSEVHNVMPYWLQINKKPRDFIKLVRMDPAVVETSFLEGKIDLAECWKGSNLPVVVSLAKTAGVQVKWISYADYGLNAYGSGFVTSEALIAKKPDVVHNFLRASYRGFEFAKQNPEQALEVLVKKYPVIPRDVGLAQIREIGDLIDDPDVRQHGLGYMRKDRMASTLTFVEKAFGLKQKVTPEDLYTNELLPKSK